MKKVMTRNVMLFYPNFDLPFYMKTYAYDFQLGDVIYQIVNNEHMSIKFYSRKLNSAQKNYTIMEKELLSIIETVNHFCHILLGFCLSILSDHKDLSFKTFTSKRVRRWRLILEEYSYVFNFIVCNQNIIANFLSKW